MLWVRFSDTYSFFAWIKLRYKKRRRVDEQFDATDVARKFNGRSPAYLNLRDGIMRHQIVAVDFGING